MFISFHCVASMVNNKGEKTGYAWPLTAVEEKIPAPFLQQYAKHITSIIDSITDGFALVDDDFKIILWNQAAERMTGLSAEKLIGSHVLERLTELFNVDVYKGFIKAVRKRQTFICDQYVRRLGFWFEINAYPSAEGVMVYFRDVTNRKKQEILLELEKRVLEINSDQKASLSTTLDYYLEGIEKIFPGMLCSVITLLDDGVSMRHLSAPSLPVNFTSAIDGLRIGPKAGSCGTAMYT